MQAAARRWLPNRTLAHLWEGLADLPGADISLLVTLPKLIAPTPTPPRINRTRRPRPGAGRGHHLDEQIDTPSLVITVKRLSERRRDIGARQLRGRDLVEQGGTCDRCAGRSGSRAPSPRRPVPAHPSPAKRPPTITTWALGFPFVACFVLGGTLDLLDRIAGWSARSHVGVDSASQYTGCDNRGHRPKRVKSG